MKTTFGAIFIFLFYFSGAQNLDSLRQQLTIAQDDSIKFELHNSLSMFYVETNFDSAMYHATEMEHLAQLLHSPTKQGDALIQKGLVYGYAYRFAEEQQYYRAAMILAESHRYERGMAVAMMNLGVSLNFQGNLDSAAIYYEAARQQFERLGEDKNLAYTYNNLGQIYRKTRKFKEAVGIYQESLKIKERLGDRKGIINTYLNLSSVYMRMDSTEQALIYALKTVELATAEQAVPALTSALLNVGQSLRMLGRMEEARSYFDQAASNIAKLHDPELQVNLAYNLVLLAQLAKNWPEMELQLRNYEEALIHYDDLETRKTYYHLRYEYYKAVGQTAKALAALEQYNEASEQFISEKSMEQINRLQQQYDSEKKERAIAQLQLEKERDERALTDSRNQRRVFILGIALLVFLAGFLYFRFYSGRKTARILAVKNQQISVALEERETLLKEIHHRVKNNLQVISSLLNLQASSLEDEAAVQAVREGQARVRSMALIHERLYDAEDIRGVQVQDYLEKLGAELFRAFGVDEDLITFQVKAHGLKLDIDTVIPLGLVLNELITNSLKYAFQGMESGNVMVSLEEKDAQLHVTVSDSGVGMDPEKLKFSNSFGWKMIRSLSRKLKAEINITSDKGTMVHMILSRYKLVL